MANKTTHPYVPSSGNLVQAFTQFRKAMPAKIDASTLKRLGIAPSNESVVISVIRFLGFIDDSGNRTKEGHEVFLKHEDAQFAKALEKHVKSAYSELFELRGDEAWNLDRDTLIGFFRATDETSALTATRQAVAFEALAALSGHGKASTPKPRLTTIKAESMAAKKATKAEKMTGGKFTNPAARKLEEIEPGTTTGGMALTVRIEVNLPAQADQEIYDRIFKSIRANLLNG